MFKSDHHVYRQALRLITVLTLLILAGCATDDPQSDDIPEQVAGLENLTQYPANSEPASEIHFEQQAIYGDSADNILGQRIAGVTVDREGRVFIADGDRMTIHIYSADGDWIESIGRRGDGPGEFQSIIDIDVDLSEERLYVLHNRHRLSIYDLGTLGHLRDLNLSLEEQDRHPYWLAWTRDWNLLYEPSHLFVRDDGNLLILFSDSGIGFEDNLDVRTYEMSLYDPSEGRYREHDLLTFDWSGQVLIHDGADGSRMIMMNVPYKRSHQFDYGAGMWVLGWTEDLALTIYDGEGEYQRAIYYPLSKVPFRLADVQGYDSEQAQQALRQDPELPDSWPAFQDVRVADDGSIWISLFHEQPDLRSWMMLASDGTLIARFTWPSNRELMLVRDGHVYLREWEESTGIQQVTSYQYSLQ